jgi:hypothetical protein
MTDNRDYSWLAAVCLDLAKKATSERDRQSYLEHARVWSRLAEKASNLHDSSVPPDKSIASH